MSKKLFTDVVDRRGTDSSKWQKYAGSDILPAWVADMDFVSAEAIIEAVMRRTRHGVFGYADPPPELEQTVCEYFQRKWQWQIPPASLVFLPGLGPAIHAVCRMAQGGDVLTPSPIYHVFRRAPEIAGARRTDAVMTQQNGEWVLPMSALEDACTPQTRIMQLCNPHNPNGKVFTRDELLALGEFCLRHNLILCADEVHADLILDEERKHICAASLSSEIADLTITLQSPSKAFNVAGLNFAVAVIPNADLRKRFHHALSGKVITHLNPLGMAAAQAAWSGECDQWLASAIQQLRANRDLLSQATASMSGITMPHLASTYLAWLNTSATGKTPADFEKAGVGMSTGESFGDARYMRLNFGCPESTLREIIRRLEVAVH